MKKLIEILDSLRDEIDDLGEDLISIAKLEQTSDYNPHFRQGYSLLPSHNFEEKILGLDEPEEKPDDKENMEEDQVNQYVMMYQAARPDYFGFIIKKVPREQLGYGVLGRAFPYLGLVEIASDLYGNDFEEVKTHEILHMQHPEKSELDIRMLTKMSLPFRPRWH